MSFMFVMSLISSISFTSLMCLISFMSVMNGESARAASERVLGACGSFWGDFWNTSGRLRGRFRNACQRELNV